MSSAAIEEVLSSVSASLHLYYVQILGFASFVLLLVSIVFVSAFWRPKIYSSACEKVASYGKFFYASFLKPHAGERGEGQQAALESFYSAQADVYDSTRKRLLHGREEMLALAVAQLQYHSEHFEKAQKPIWVDIGGGTGWNIEAMGRFVDVPSFFSEVILVDLSPSLIEVARKRFLRLGWSNVRVVCQDGCLFNLGDAKASLLTLSYSLSMIPSFHVLIDAASSLLDANGGIIGVVDFYVQNGVEASGRNYTGGSLQRHVSWLGRTFWRAWFDLDRVGLEGARRDYLEYRFGTLKTIDQRNYILGGRFGINIPYYIFIGRPASSTPEEGELIERLDAACRESPYLSARQHRLDMSTVPSSEVRSKAYQSAIVNLSAKLPLPSAFYQNQHHRILYNENLPKHTQFGQKFIYAFTWEDSRVDLRLLKITPDDVILCITSAGDNLLDYIFSANPRRVHAVDLNPNQNHLLEIKVAAYQALPYADFWRMFGEGTCPNFKAVLIEKLSPFMSSHAFQFWYNHTEIFTSSRGLYEHGGSGDAIRLVRLLLKVCGLGGVVQAVCNAKTLNEQREIWPRIRRVLMSRAFHWMFLGTGFLWKAAGVPPNQSAMIVKDHLDQEGVNHLQVGMITADAEAMWQYLANTVDPVARETLISEDNFYYLLCLNGKYNRRCHPNYVSAKAHAKLSRPGAFDGLRIHTDEINEVIRRVAPNSLTIAVVMDSMDWFDQNGQDAENQIRSFNYALKMGGRVLLRSAGLKPWYIKTFDSLGFTSRRVGARLPGTCIDRVNMYASTWISTKTQELDPSYSLDKLEI